MPSDKIDTTMRFNADISNFKAAMSEANRAAKLANSEFEAVSSGMDDWAKSTDGLSAKLKQLATVQAAEERKLNVLKKAYAEVVEEQGENSKAAQELLIKINKQQAAVNKVSKEYDRYTDMLKDAERGTDDAADALEDMERGAEDAADALDEAGDAAKEAGKDAAESGDGWSIAKDVISDLVSEGISALIDALASAAEETREYRREMSKMAENAKGAGHDIEDMKDVLEEVASVTGETDAAMEGLNMLMASGLDTSGIELAADALSGAAMQFSGLKFEAIAEGLQETLAVGEAAGPFAELIERMGGDLEEFNEGLAACTTAAEKQQYTLKWLADSGLKEVHDAYVQNNADLVEAEAAQFRANEAMAALGAAVEPVTTKLTNLKAEILEGLTPVVENIIGYVMDNLPGIAPIITGVATALGVMAGALAIISLVKALRTAFVALNATLAANPIILVASALAGLAAGIASFVANESKRFVDSAKEWAASVTSFKGSINQARKGALDLSNVLSSTGKTMDELKAEISEAENGITDILSTAMAEQRALREEEIRQIQEYKERIRALEQEKLAIYRDQMQAEATMLQNQTAITQEEAAKSLGYQMEYLEMANEAARSSYQTELIQIQNKHKAAGTLNSQARIDEELAAKAHYDKQIAENEKYYNQSTALVMEAATEWVKTDAKKWAAIGKTEKESAEKYMLALNKLNADSANAFMTMYAEVKRTGGTVSAEADTIANDILMAFYNLPYWCEDVGHEALMGIISGIQDEFPRLKDASEMTAENIVVTLQNDLQVHSPSRVTRRIGGYVTEGLAVGMEEKEGWLSRKISNFAGRALSWIQDAFGINSPSEETEWMGEMLVAGLVNALRAGKKEAQEALAELTGTTLDGVNVGVNGTGGGVTGGKTIIFNQTNNSPRALNRREIYRQTFNALSYAGGV